jgi:hypothetical protein
MAANSFFGRTAALRGARNPHVPEYIPVAALRAPCISSQKSEFSATHRYIYQEKREV